MRTPFARQTQTPRFRKVVVTKHGTQSMWRSPQVTSVAATLGAIALFRALRKQERVQKLLTSVSEKRQQDRGYATTPQTEGQDQRQEEYSG